MIAGRACLVVAEEERTLRKRIPIAKISVPRLFGVVPRTRLFSRLDDNRGRPLIWLDSPPGAGKSSLVASYLDARSIPVLWYQIDTGNADPVSMFHYLEAATQKFSAQAESPLPRFLAEHLSDPADFARTYFRELFVRIPEGTVIVFDNYQEASPECALHNIIRAAIDEVPPGNSIVCVSRSEAPPAYAALAARGAMHTLRWDALKLTLEETREIASGRDIADDWLVRALHQQSDGWAAGITLMLERLDQSTLSTPIHKYTHVKSRLSGHGRVANPCQVPTWLRLCALPWPETHRFHFVCVFMNWGT